MAGRKFYDAVGYDFIWSSNDGPEWKGRRTSMGHAVFQQDGTDYDPNVYCPFKTPEDVLSFNPVEEYGLPDVNERTAFFEEQWQKAQAAYPNQVVPGAIIRRFSLHASMFLVGTCSYLPRR